MLTNIVSPSENFKHLQNQMPFLKKNHTKLRKIVYFHFLQNTKRVENKNTPKGKRTKLTTK